MPDKQPMKGNWTRYVPPAIRRRIEGRAELQTILGNISWLSLDSIIHMTVGLLVGVWVARYLGPGQYGTLNFAIAFVTLFSPLAKLGLDSIVTRDLVRSPELKETTLGTAFVLKLSGGMASGLVSVAIIMISRPADLLLQALVIITAASVLLQSFDPIDYWFQSKVKAKFVVYARDFGFLLSAAAKVGLILLHAPLIAFAWAAFFEVTAAAAGLIILYRRDGQALGAWRAGLARAKALLHDSWPLFLSGVSVAIYMRIDQVMIGYMLDDAAVGTYAVAIRLVEIWYFLPGAIAASTLPALIRARKEDEALYLKRLQIFFDIMGALSLAIAVLISVFSTIIIGILYGQRYAAAGPILAVYAWATVPVFLGVASNQHFLIENRTRIALYRTFAGVVVSVLLNLALIPAYGPVGAAITTLVSQSVVAFSIGLFPGSGNQLRMLLSALSPVRWARYVVKR